MINRFFNTKKQSSEVRSVILPAHVPVSHRAVQTTVQVKKGTVPTYGSTLGAVRSPSVTASKSTFVIYLSRRCE
jgi:hypothetical protein